MDNYSFNESNLISGYFNYLHLHNGTMIDVGAHVGSSLLPFARLGWRVLAFEAEENNFKELGINTKPFAKVEIINNLVSDIDGERKFYISPKHWGIHSIKPFHKTHTQSITLNSVTLERAIRENEIGHVNFLKIDVEGADFLVIKGFNFKNDSPDIVICEFMDDRTVPYFQYSYHDVVKYMKSFGYSCYVFEWSKIVGGYGEKGIPKQSTKFLDFYPYSKNHNPNWGNIVFIKKPMYWFFGIYVRHYIKKYLSTK